MLLVTLITDVKQMMKLFNESLKHDTNLVDGLSSVHLIFFVYENFLSSFTHFRFYLSLSLLY